MDNNNVFINYCLLKSKGNEMIYDDLIKCKCKDTYPLLDPCNHCYFYEELFSAIEFMEQMVEDGCKKYIYRNI